MITFKHSIYAALPAQISHGIFHSPALPTTSTTFLLAPDLVPQQLILRGVPSGSNTRIIALLSHDQNQD
jgi:hypothetical protein